MQVNLLNLYERCLSIPYIHLENDADYAIQILDNTLYIYFEGQTTKVDWVNNFNFPAVPYKDMEQRWYCHKGFLKVWKTIKPKLNDVVHDTNIKNIVIVGYSHGAAIATLCHEYCWFERPDLRENNIVGFGFGCPRCFFGWKMKAELRERWKHFYPIRDFNDIVTHVPFVLMGFIHVNDVFEINRTGEDVVDEGYHLTCINAHAPKSYIKALSNLYKNGFLSEGINW